MKEQEIDAQTDVLKAAAVVGAIAATAGVVAGFLLAGFAWWVAALAGAGMLWAEAVCWTVVFRQREAARQRAMLARMSGEDAREDQSA